ncbi:MAG TPA: hypothetical protein VJI98_04520 [Candidatus Nanoarchaeia archaeon]|nr:hypothetical protein [Candidatus Nanoarchaeia archaeon]
MRRGSLIVVLFISLFVLSACQPGVSGGERPLETAAALERVKTGTQGVEIEIVPNYPPETIYDQNELISLVDVKNVGNDDLDLQDCFIHITGFDKNIIRGGLELPRSCAEGLNILEGKSVYNLDGGFNQIEFRSPNIALPFGIPNYQPRLNFLACYNYHTIASPQVCIDPLLYQVSPQQKACDYRKGVNVGGGQGGPVGISHVGVDMVGNRAIFDITVSNFGSGQVLSPFTNIQACSDANLQRTDFDKVGYSVRLSDSIGNCNPQDNIVRLSNGRGKIVCSFDVPGTSAYETLLLIDLDYGYINSISKSINVIRTPR